MAISAQAEVQRCKNMIHVKTFYPLAPMPRSVFLPLPPLFLFFPLHTCSLFNSLASTSPIFLPTTTFLREHFSKTTKSLKVKIRTVFRLNTFEEYVD